MLPNNSPSRLKDIGSVKLSNIKEMGAYPTRRTSAQIGVKLVRLVSRHAMLVDSNILLLLCTVSTGYPLSIEYSLKIYFIVFKAFNGLAPLYISELLQPFIYMIIPA